MNEYEDQGGKILEKYKFAEKYLILEILKDLGSNDFSIQTVLDQRG